jgi:hypothetical protein
MRKAKRIQDRAEESALIRAWGHLNLQDRNVCDAVLGRARQRRRVATPESLHDHRLAVIGGSHEQEVRHAGALREGEQILEGGEGGLRPGVGDPAIGANAPDPIFCAVFDHRSR